MKKMINIIQHYNWGSKNILARLYGIANPSSQPMAELWMGAHPKSSSRIISNQGNNIPLYALIDRDPVIILGKTVADRFGKLPFLFKVLCVNEPLSIQVHPNISAAREGFAKENQAGIALDAVNRNFKDNNHKPELIFALMPFQVMNGFREISVLISLLQLVKDAHPTIATFLTYPDEQHLAQLFSDLLSMTGKTKYLALGFLKSVLSYRHGEPWDTIRMINSIYPDDNGLFSPLLLNVITLKPSQAMFLFPQTPHSYLKGVALEVMANSDNVLRAGLTSKHIDLPEFMANIKFITKPENMLLFEPRDQGDDLFFSVPVEDFSFSLHILTLKPRLLTQNSASILFCIDGQATVNCHGQQLTLQSGESAFITAIESPVIISGSGLLSRVYNQL